MKQKLSKIRLLLVLIFSGLILLMVMVACGSQISTVSSPPARNPEQGTPEVITSTYAPSSAMEEIPPTQESPLSIPTPQSDTDQIPPTQESPLSTPTPQSDTDQIQIQPITPSNPASASTSDQQSTSSGDVPVAVISGKVTVRLSASSYKQGEIIMVTVANGLEQTLYTEDMKTGCSIVTLERSDGTIWQPIQDCSMRRAPSILAISANRGQFITIDRSSTDFGSTSDSSEAALGKSIYRVKFTYRLNPEPEGEEPFTAFSETFTILPQ